MVVSISVFAVSEETIIEESAWNRMLGREECRDGRIWQKNLESVHKMSQYFLDILEEYFNRSWGWINGLCRLGSCFLGLGEMGFFPLAFALLHCILIADTFVDTMYTYLDPE